VRIEEGGSEERGREEKRRAAQTLRSLRRCSEKEQGEEQGGFAKSLRSAVNVFSKAQRLKPIA